MQYSSSWTHVLFLLGMFNPLCIQGAISSREVTVDLSSSQQHSPATPAALFNDTIARTHIKRNLERAPSREEREDETLQRRRRLQERRNKSKQLLASLSQRADKPPQTEQEAKSPVHRLTREEIQSVQRKTSWFGGGNGYSYNAALGYLADPTTDYDKWAQAYRMLGAFIDCDHQKSEGSGDNGGGGGGDAENGCSRWMMWASYVNPNYQGYEYDEYFSDEPYSALDCHNPDTEWELLGVYRQEFYQYIEQISKHLWAIDDYEYIVARAGLMYMGDEDCFQVGNDANGNAIRAGVQPLANGRFQMALYTDEYCLEPDESVGVYDDFVGQTDVDLGSKDEGDGEAEDLYDWWYDAQEYTLTNLNDVYEEFMYCTPCMDYPTYQDGYFIGDYGTDDDDLINQCWKFHSHDSFICEGECIAMGHSQGSINQVLYGEMSFGVKMSAYSGESSGSTSSNRADVLVESSWSRIMANAFLTFSFLLFVATFLAFAVARRSRYRESRSSKSRRLLDEGHHDDDGAGHRSVRSRRSRSRKKKRGASASRRSGSARKRDDEGDGLFRTSDPESDRGENQRSGSRSRRSKSRSGSKRGRSKSDSKKRPSSGSVGRKSRSRDRNAAGGGDPPSRSRKSSAHDDNF